MAYKLLLADDSITIQKVVELTLSEEGFDVTAVGDGEAALDAAAKLMPDIVLADIFMPKMDGYQLCEKLKSDARFSNVPVMLLSGTFEEYDEARASKVGAQDRLTKPFESAELIYKVRNLVENRAPAMPVAETEAEAEVFAAEAVESDAGDASDDLWSVVDMSSEEQPLAGATEVMSEEDLWKRANLTNEPEAAEEAEDFDAMPIEELPMEEEAFEVAEEAEEVPAAFLAEDTPEVEPYPEPFPAYESTDQTAVLNMEDIQSSIYRAEPEEVAAIDVVEVDSEPEIMSFESLGEATAATGYAPEPRPQAPAPQAAPAAMSEDQIRSAVASAAGAIIEAKIKEALSAMSGEMIERIVWDVVPELAEEIIRKEVDRIKAGS